MRQQQAHPGIARQVAGKQQPRHRDRRVGEAPDRVDQIVAVEPVVAADVMRVQEDRGVARRRHLPERVERRVVEIAADALRLGRDHRAAEPGVERLFQHLCRERAILQRHGGERGQLGQRRGVLRHVLVVEARPVGALGGRQVVAVDIGPAADELVVDPRRLQPVAALRQIVQPRLDRPPRPAAGERHPRRRGIVQRHRRKQPRLAAHRVEQRRRHDMGMGVDDHRVSFSAGSMSVWTKSLPLNSSGCPVARARA